MVIIQAPFVEHSFKTGKVSRTDIHAYIDIYTFLSTQYFYTYIQICRERERVCVCVHICACRFISMCAAEP